MVSNVLIFGTDQIRMCSSRAKSRVCSFEQEEVLSLKRPQQRCQLHLLLVLNPGEIGADVSLSRVTRETNRGDYKEGIHPTASKATPCNFIFHTNIFTLPRVSDHSKNIIGIQVHNLLPKTVWKVFFTCKNSFKNIKHYTRIRLYISSTPSSSY